MRIMVGHSEDPSAAHAVAEVIDQIESQLEGQTPAGALLYTCIDIDHQAILDGIQAWRPGLPLIGCTTDGECSSVLKFAEDSVVLTVFVGEGLDLRIGLGERLREDLGQAAEEAFRQVARPDDPISLIIALPESIGVSGHQVVQTLNRHLPEGAVVVGGTAGDQWRFESTFQFFEGQLLTGALPIMAFGSSLEVSVGVASGWKPMGRTGEVTARSRPPGVRNRRPPCDGVPAPEHR